MRKKGLKVTALFEERRRENNLQSALAVPAASLSTALGWIVAAHVEDQDSAAVMVDFPGSPQGVQAARLGMALTTAQIEAAVSTRQPAVLVFENGDPLLPILVGLIQAPSQAAAPATVVEADVDGKRVRVVGQDEIVLQCGQASVTLRRNGRVVIRGTYVETHSEGTNRIKGGQVQIN
jgi:Domain of unknown function (DUF6484)